MDVPGDLLDSVIAFRQERNVSSDEKGLREIIIAGLQATGDWDGASESGQPKPLRFRNYLDNQTNPQYEFDIETLDTFPDDLRIRSVSDFLERVFNLHRVTTQQRGTRNTLSETSSLGYYYRGQPGPYPLLPNLLRPRTHNKLKSQLESALGRADMSPNEIQRNLIFRLSRYAEQYHPATGILAEINDYLSWMCVGQHHGLPTFLMDWAVNALASLFFACQNTSSVDERLNGVVWCMKIKGQDQRNRNTLLHLERFPFHSDPEDPLEAQDIYEEISEIKKICRNCAIKEDSPRLLVPRMLTRRIEVQAGRFLATSKAVRVNRIMSYSNKNIAWEEIKPLATIDPGDKREILIQLKHLRYHHGSIYADLDSYAKFLSAGNL